MKRIMGSLLLLLALLLLATVSYADSQRIYLQDMNYGEIEQEWSTVQANKSVDGAPLTIAGKTYPVGIGTHANSEAYIKLNGIGEQFHALAGVDDEVNAVGTVIFQVWTDEKLAAESPVMRKGDKPFEFNVNLAGVKTLSLFVRDAGDTINYDHADWVDAWITFSSNTEKPEFVRTRDMSIPQIAHIFAGKPQINGPSVVGCTTGKPFLYMVPATAACEITYSASGLPSGLSLDPSTGIITGKVNKSGNYVIKVTVAGSLGKATRKIKIVAGKNKLALTPPMGWNSWNCFAGVVDDEKIRTTADLFIQKGLAAHGYQYVNIDDCWQKEHDANGKMVSNERFPDMKALCDYVHSKGLKIGIYSSPGPKTCAGYEGSYQRELQDAQTWAEWGFDYIKYDWCSYGSIAKGSSLEELQKPYILMAECLDKVDRDIVYSLCQYGMGDVWKWGAKVNGNLWRTTGDITDTWSSMAGIGFNQAGKEPYASPGHWNDPDMLVVGHVGWGNPHPTRLTPNEQLTHITLWSMLSSPMLIGCDLTKLDRFTLDLLTNDEVLAVNQDSLGKQASRVSSKNGLEVWVKTLADKTKAVALFNRSPIARVVNADFRACKIQPNQPVRDLWKQKDLGQFESKYSVKVPSHGAVLVKIGKPRPEF